MTLEYSSWPVGDGEMARLIASHDWALTSIGPSDAWPQPLRTMVEVMLASPMLMSLAAGPERVFLYNDEAARYYGRRHPSVLGLSLSQAFAHEFSKVAAFYDRVFAGESLHIPAQPLDPDESGTMEVFDAYLVPVRDTTGCVIAAAMTGFAVGKRLYAEARLRESEERLALAFKTLPVGIAIVDAIGDTVMANDEMQRFLPTGKIPSLDPVRSGRWQGWDVDGAIVQPKDFPSARALRGENVSPGMQMLFEDDAGAKIWTEVLSAPLPDGQGRTNGAITVVIDVNRLKRSEQAAQESDERLRQFGEASLDILWIRDAETLQWTYLTPAFEEIYGLSREEVLSGNNYREWLHLIVPEDRIHAMASIDRVAAGEQVTFEYRIRRPVDGQVRWLRDTDFPMRDASGRVVRIGGVGHDVTELKASQTAMMDSETRLRTLTEGIPQLVWRSCDKGLWTWCSPQWMRFTGQSQEESHGLGWRNVVHPDDHAVAAQAWDEAQLHGMVNVELRVRRASDDAWIWHSTRSVPVRNGPGRAGADGPITEWLGTTTDIHDLKRLQGEQQILVAELQHRTRNLLAVVRNIARRSISPSPERDEYDARLGAIGRVQGFLSRSPGFSVLLGDVVQAELQAAGDRVSSRVTVSGPVVDLPGESVQIVALAVHELATNAVKYGAIGQPVARLSVTWRIEASDEEAPCLIITGARVGWRCPSSRKPTVDLAVS